MNAGFLCKLVKMSGMETLSKPEWKCVWRKYKVALRFPDMRIPIHTEIEADFEQLTAAQ